MFMTMPRITSSSSSSTSPEKSNSATTASTTTTTLSSLDGNNSTITSNNRICQWYCCSCGQSYGTVLYKDDYNSYQPNGEPEQHRATTLDSSNYILDNLKYYSQVVYRDHKHALSNGSASNDPHSSSYSTSSSSSSTNYFNCKERSQTVSSSNNLTISSASSSSATILQHQDTLEKHSPESPTYLPNNTNNLISPLNVDLNDNLIDYQEKIILNIPTRFTCHRCSHMMCPYCPKLRLKDLH